MSGERELVREYRRELHQRIDHVTGELIARYRENPTLALTAEASHRIQVAPEHVPCQAQ